MPTVRTGIALFFASAAALVSPVLGQQASIQALGWLDDDVRSSTARGVSDDGKVVVGYSHRQGIERATRWTAADGLQDLGALVSDGFSGAYGASSDGSVVVGEAEAADNRHAFLWTASGMVDLGTLEDDPSHYSHANDVSDDGSVVVGFSYIGHAYRHAFRWADGEMVDLGTIGDAYGESVAYGVSSDGSVVVGYSSPHLGHPEAFLWNEDDGMVGLGTLGLAPPPMITTSEAHAVSGDGKVVVGKSDGRPFVWTAEHGMTALSGSGVAQAVSYDGRVIGGVRNEAACVWIDGEAHSLWDLLDAYGVDTSDWSRKGGVTGCSADGRVLVGVGQYQGASTAFRVSLPANRPPTVETPSPVVVECEGGTNFATLSARVDDADGDPLRVTWTVDGVQRQATQNVAPGTTVEFDYDYPHGESVVVVRVSDGTASASAETTVTVQDTTAPTLVAAPNVVVPTDRHRAFATNVKLTPPDVFDACDGDPVLRYNAPKRFALGTTVVVWVAVDADGNRARSRQRVTVQDREPPRIGAVPNVKVRIGGDAKFANVRLDPPKAIDNAPGTIRLTHDAPKRFPIGATVVTWTATDAAGNRAKKSFTVSVRRGGYEYRPNGAYATYYAGEALPYAYASLGTAYNDSGLTGYYYALYAEQYARLAGDGFRWTNDRSRSQAFAAYVGLRYYQYVFSQQAANYLYASYAASADVNALYGYVFSSYAAAYAEADFAN